MHLSLKKLDAAVDTTSFHCTQKDGTKPLERFLKVHALDNQKKRLSVTWVALSGNKVCGYFSLASASIAIDVLNPDEKTGYPKYTYYPAVLIGKFAVDDSCRNMGVGKWMMDRLVTLVLISGKITAAAFLMVESKEESISYYRDVLQFKPTHLSSSGHLVMTRKLELEE